MVVSARAGRFRILEGRQRCKAIAQLAEAAEWPTPARVDALIVEGEQAGRVEARAGLTLALHASRSASPASELRAIESIFQVGDGEALTVKEISAQTGMSFQTVRRRLRLRSLIPGLRAAFDEGRITASVAEAAARLPEARQRALEEHFVDAGRLSLGDVRGVARERIADASSELPGGLFREPEVAWRVTVRGHLTAALHAIPMEEPHARLVRTVSAALAAADTSEQEGER